MAALALMLKQIPTSQVQLGMFLQAMEGSWLSHPFWKTKFVLQEQSDLDALLASDVPSVWIDTSKGRAAPLAAHAPLQSGQTGTNATGAAVAASGAPKRAPKLPVRASLSDELERAAQIVSSSRRAVVALFNEARLGRAVDAEQCLPLVDEVAGSIARNPSALISLARLKRKDDYTYMHSVAVCALMVALAKQLGLADAPVREAGLAGLLHDIGKMMVPQTLLDKPSELTADEFAIIQTHPVRGYKALKDGGMVPGSALDVCLHHHEKMDGTGYPEGLAGEQISLLARMGAVCDVYDAITSIRPYKPAWDPAGALQRMSQWAGHFDPAVFQAFVKCIGIYPIGALVKLQSGRLAVVVDQNALNLIAPVVRVFYSTKSKLPIPLQLLDLSSGGANDRIVGRELPQEWGFTHLDEIWRAGGP